MVNIILGQTLFLKYAIAREKVKSFVCGGGGFHTSSLFRRYLALQILINERLGGVSALLTVNSGQLVNQGTLLPF